MHIIILFSICFVCQPVPNNQVLIGYHRGVCVGDHRIDYLNIRGVMHGRSHDPHNYDNHCTCRYPVDATMEDRVHVTNCKIDLPC